MSLSLIPLMFLVGGFAFTASGVRTRRSVGDLPQDWTAVTGIVVDAARPQRIEYVSPEGRRLRVQGTLSSSLVRGSEVGVLVDPADPSRARLVDADRAAASLARMFIALGIVSFVLGALALVAFG